MTDAVGIKELPTGDAQVYYHSKPLYSAKPRDSARRRVARLTIQPDTLIIWSSPLLWYGLDELLTTMPAGTRIFAVERDPQLFELTKRSLHKRDERVTLFDGGAQSIEIMLSLVNRSRLRRVVELTTSSAAMSQREEYRRVAGLLERQIRITWQNRRTLQAMSKLWVRNIQRNLAYLPCANVPTPHGFKDAIVCGAGPSLEKSIGLLHDIRDRLTVVAVDTALPVLDANGIIPDVVVALEGQLYNAYDFLPVATREYDLISDLTASVHVVELHEAVAWTFSRFDATAFVQRLATLPGVAVVLPPLGSVGVAAVDIAQRLSSGRIFLSGLDFAVQPGRTHARGAPSYIYGMAASRRLNPVRDRGVEVQLHRATGDRGTVGTTQVLLGYARDLERVADPSRCLVLEPEGVALSLPKAGITDAVELTGRAADRPPFEAPTDELVARRAAHIGRFVMQEISQLERLLAGNSNSSADSAMLLAHCDYLTADSGFVETDATELARAPSTRINAEYFLSHWKLTQRLLTDRYR